MGLSHKHLAISDEEWDSFIAGLHEVCDEIGLPQQEVDDVTAVIQSLRADCTLADGEAAPPNPGHPAPPGGSLYARLGGVYPIALFADRLVDALIAERARGDDDRFKVATDDKRNASSLKYCFTEFMCNACGGPEVVTARDEAITHLGVPRSLRPQG